MDNFCTEEEGRARSPDEAVREAMALWVERERRRTELLASLDAAEASLARGDGIEISQESMATLAHDVMERHRDRFKAERSASV